jgi:hypothetical protein
MSALDDAIAHHMAHGAGACADPLTDSMAEQCTQPVLLRPGWENEVPEPPVHKGWALSVLLATIFVCWLLSGCGGGDLLPDEEDLKRIVPHACATNPEVCR